MRITFGIHRNKKIEDLGDEELAGLLQWIQERVGSWSRFQEKPMQQHAQAITRELRRRSQETAAAEEEEIIETGPQTVLARLSGAAVKLLLAFMHISQREGAQPFPASREELMKLSGIRAKATFAAAKAELLDLEVLSEPTRADFRLTLVGSENDLYPVLSSLLFSSLEAETNTVDGPIIEPSADRTDAARTAWRILSGGRDPSDEDVRFARTRLNHLLRQGATIDEAMLVARWCRNEYTSGGQRFTPLLDLVYIWTPPRFASYLSAAKAKVVKGGYSIYSDPESREESHREATELLRKKGIIS